MSSSLSVIDEFCSNPTKVEKGIIDCKKEGHLQTSGSVEEMKICLLDKLFSGIGKNKKGQLMLSLPSQPARQSEITLTCVEVYSSPQVKVK